MKIGVVIKDASDSNDVQEISDSDLKPRVDIVIDDTESNEGPNRQTHLGFIVGKHLSSQMASMEALEESMQQLLVQETKAMLFYEENPRMKVAQVGCIYEYDISNKDKKDLAKLGLALEAEQMAPK